MNPTLTYRIKVYTSKGFNSWDEYLAFKCIQRQKKLEAKLLRPSRARRTVAAIEANAETPPVDVPLEHEFINQAALDRIMLS